MQQGRKTWREKANCRGADIAVFFPDVNKGDCGGRLLALYEPALQFCRDCTVKLECLETQLEHEELSLRFDGVWGGLMPHQRRELLANRAWAENTKPR